eukprot:gene720-7166_t
MLLPHAVLSYDPATRALVDGRGAGGVLPQRELPGLLIRLRDLADDAGAFAAP